jgi:imidazole glycerol-phosphate synthase subunit HisF
MTTRRLIVCLDMKAGRVVKGKEFTSLRDVGDPAELASRYEADGADEVVFLDVSASEEERAPLLDVARRTAEQLFIPLTVGGGIATVDGVLEALRAGADKVAVNTAAVLRPDLIGEAREAVGSQCVVVSIDAKREGNGWRVYTHGGKRPTGLDAVAWARQAATLGAGEILLTRIERDGARSGYDLALTRAVSEAVDVPVVASGGAGSAADVVRAFTEGKAEAALVAGILHDGTTTVALLKRGMRAAGLRVRGEGA